MSQPQVKPLYREGQHATALVVGRDGEPYRLDGRIDRVVVRPTGFVWYKLSTRERIVPEDRIVRASAASAPRRIAAGGRR